MLPRRQSELGLSMTVADWLTVAWHTSLARWTGESFLESKGQSLLKHEFDSARDETHIVHFRVLWMKNCSQITIKGERLSKQMTGELPMSSVWKNCLKPPPLKKAHNSPVHPHPGTYNGRALGLDLSANRKWGRSAPGFHSNPTLPRQLSPRGNTFLVKSWCDCWWWWWLYQLKLNDSCVVYEPKLTDKDAAEFRASPL